MPRIPIAIGSSEARSRPLIAARVVNLFAETPPNNSRAPGYSKGAVKAVLYGTPGLKTPTFAGNAVRAMRPFNNYLYVLSGATLYRIDSAGVVTLCIGAAMAGTGTAMMTNNRTQLGILVNGITYYVNTTNTTTVVLVNDADYPAAGASSFDYIDGYIIWTVTNSDQFFISALEDITSIDALDFATAESSTDGLVRVLVDHRIAWLMGEATIEPWTNVGTSPFPFDRIPNAILPRGCAAVLSPVEVAGIVCWLGNDRVIYRAQGFQPTRMSTDAIEDAIKSGTVSDAFGMTYTLGGHQFYVITFPTLSRTFCFDLSSGVPHERQSTTQLPYTVWNATCITEAFGKTYVGTSDGLVCEMDLDTYAEAGEPIRRLIRSAPIFAEGKRAVLDEVEIEMELGVGLNTGQGSDPQVMLRVSKDGGSTWSNERSESCGVTGERRKRVTFLKLGVFREAMLEFAISDPVKVAVYGMNYRARALGE